MQIFKWIFQNDGFNILISMLVIFATKNLLYNLPHFKWFISAVFSSFSKTPQKHLVHDMFTSFQF